MILAVHIVTGLKRKILMPFFPLDEHQTGAHKRHTSSSDTDR